MGNSINTDVDSADGKASEEEPAENAGEGLLETESEHIINMDDKIKIEEAKVRAEEEIQQNSLYFNDGCRKIDFVLVYPATSNSSKELEIRETFEKNLETEGLALEREERTDGKFVFVKIHAPWDVLTRVAELIPLKMPIKECDIDSKKQFWCFESCANPLALDSSIVPKPTGYFTADFSREREHMFIIDDKDKFFTNAQRGLIVNELLLRAGFNANDSSKFGVDKLLKLGVYSSAYPLHDGYYWSHQSITLESKPLNDRHVLYEMWASAKKWYKLQPMDLVRKYFGEKIAIYCAWLGYYTYMLLLAALVGLLVFVFGLASLPFNTPSEEICDKNGVGQTVMCPLCDRNCPYWPLHISCIYARLTHVFDNYATVFFAGFMAVWSTAFLVFWKRQEAVYQYNWDMTNFHREEHIRPDFEVRVKSRKMNPVTKIEEPFLPWYRKIPRQLTSLAVVLFMVFSVLGAVFGVIMYRIIVLSVLYVAPEEILHKNAKIITSITAALLCLICISLLNMLYQKIAIWLTDLEYCRTESEYEDSFIFKMFVFQFINYYASIFYIAFFKGRIGGRPGEYDYRLGYRAEECDPGGCLVELCIQLATVMIGKQALNNFQEVMWPKIVNWYRKQKSPKKASDKKRRPQWEVDNDLLDYPPLGLFEDYLEMVIQYGFITIFAAAFPLAPLFALLNNVIEIRLDAYKLVTQWKRPVSCRAQDIGIWYGILKGITYIGIITNFAPSHQPWFIKVVVLMMSVGFIIGWTSDFIPKMVYKYSYSGDVSLAGYVNNSLSYFDVSEFQNRSIPAEDSIEGVGKVGICRYPDYREPPWSENKYEYTSMYWHVFCARLAFVILFEHLVLFLTWFVSYMIPPVPGDIQLLVLREMYLAKEARYKVAFNTLNDERSQQVRQRKVAAEVSDELPEHSSAVLA